MAEEVKTQKTPEELEQEVLQLISLEPRIQETKPNEKFLAAPLPPVHTYRFTPIQPKEVPFDEQRKEIVEFLNGH